MFKELRSAISANFPSYVFIINVAESKNGSMVRKKRGKGLGEQKLKLFETIKNISECVYKYYSQRSRFVLVNYFPYFRLLRNYSNYHFHFLVISNEYFCKNDFI